MFTKNKRCRLRFHLTSPEANQREDKQIASIYQHRCTEPPINRNGSVWEDAEKVLRLWLESNRSFYVATSYLSQRARVCYFYKPSIHNIYHARLVAYLKTPIFLLKNR